MQDLVHCGGSSRRPPFTLREIEGRTTAGRRALLVVAALVLALVASSCLAKSGSYAPIDWAAEMHYTQSYRPQEPPRLDTPPGSVPYKFPGDDRELTREPSIAPLDFAALTNPRAGEAAGSAEAVELFRWNCSHCHGMEGAGDGRVSAYLQAYSYVPVPDLTAEATVEKSDGDLYGILTNGVLVMPAFKNLLSPEDRWLLVDYVRELQGR